MATLDCKFFTNFTEEQITEIYDFLRGFSNDDIIDDRVPYYGELFTNQVDKLGQLLDSVPNCAKLTVQSVALALVDD